MNSKGYGRNLSRANFGYHAEICLEGLRKATINFNYDSRSLEYRVLIMALSIISFLISFEKSFASLKLLGSSPCSQSVRATCPENRIFIHVIVLIISGEDRNR